MTLRIASVVAVALAVAQPGLAQDPDRSEACTYAACALRLQSDRIVAGVDARVVGEFGFFSLPDVEGLVAASDSASVYAGAWHRHAHRERSLNIAAGSLFLVGSLLSLTGEEGSATAGVGVGAVLGGLGLSFWSLFEGVNAADALQTTMWWYNLHLAQQDAGRRGRPPD